MSHTLEKNASVARARWISPAQGHRVKHPAGADLCIKVFAHETHGVYSLMETVLPPGGVIPLHIHAAEDENNYIVEGELLMTIGEDIFHAKAGSFVVSPRGVTHVFRNLGDEPCRFLTTFVPGGAEGFFKEIGDLAAKRAPEKPTQAEIDALRRKYNIAYL